MERKPSVWGSALAAAALGVTMGTRLARDLLGEAATRAATLTGLPRPRAADWIEALRPALAALARLDALLELAAFALAACLLVQLVRVLNPRGRLRRESGPTFTGPWHTVPLDERVAARTAAAVVACIYLFGGFRWLWQAGTSLLPAPLAWGLTGLMFHVPGGPLPGLVLASLAGGALLWLLWGERGVLSPAAPRRARPPSVALTEVPLEDPTPPSSAQPPAHERDSPSVAADDVSTPPPALTELATRGALAGLVALPLLLPFTEVGRTLLRGLSAALSVTAARPWQLLAAAQWLWFPLALLLIVCVVRALGAPGIVASRRIARVLIPAVVAATAAVGETVFFYDVAVGRYGLGVPLARALPALKPIAEGRAYLVFGPDGAGYGGIVPYGSIQGYAAGRALQQPVWEYLRRRDYQTPDTSRLFVHLYDSAAVDWDSAEILRICLAELEGNPEQIFAQLLLEKLESCAITPENRAALDALADPARFRFEGTAARAMLAGLYRRFGDRERTRRAPQGNDPPVDAGREPLRDGIVAGRVLIEGRALPDLRVGLVPAAQASALPGRPRPFAHRLVAAATTADTTGAFRISHLGDGDYLLIAMAKDRNLPLSRPIVAVSNPPRVLHLDRRQPTRDLGTIDARIRTRFPGARSIPAPADPRVN